MLIVDDILLSPFRGMLWLASKVHQAAEEEISTQAESITAELRSLYMLLETGQMSEQEYDAREKTLLDRLEACNREKGQS